MVGDNSGVTGVQIRDARSGAKSKVDLTGVFIAIGHTPNTEIFQGQVDMANGYIITKSGLAGQATATSVPGVFAAGDATTVPYKQIIVAMGAGATAKFWRRI